MESCSIETACVVFSVSSSTTQPPLNSTSVRIARATSFGRFRLTTWILENNNCGSGENASTLNKKLFNLSYLEFL